MAKAVDFDQDGDLDLAVIAYYADFEHAPEKGFVYFENISKEGYKFKAYTLKKAKKGRWGYAGNRRHRSGRGRRYFAGVTDDEEYPGSYSKIGTPTDRI